MSSELLLLGVSQKTAPVALRERLEARRRQQRPAALLQEVAALQAFLREQPDRDPRSADAILGYDAFGLPG